MQYTDYIADCGQRAIVDSCTQEFYWHVISCIYMLSADREAYKISGNQQEVVWELSSDTNSPWNL